ncbi:hypothetical protein OG225_42160 (plasmid) [Nocardia sp. NBC_01377]|uniref:hypothetical protein n=1 Tax=Nocardia sp. NBC_01377 TaxID=2903595 RepID=UPI0032561763
MAMDELHERRFGGRRHSHGSGLVLGKTGLHADVRDDAIARVIERSTKLRRLLLSE